MILFVILFTVRGYCPFAPLTFLPGTSIPTSLAPPPFKRSTMANTQGLDDDQAAQRLMRFGSVEDDLPTLGVARRWDAPVGDRPAARFTRVVAPHNSTSVSAQPPPPSAPEVRASSSMLFATHQTRPKKSVHLVDPPTIRQPLPSDSNGPTILGDDGRRHPGGPVAVPELDRLNLVGSIVERPRPKARKSKPSKQVQLAQPSKSAPAAISSSVSSSRFGREQRLVGGGSSGAAGTGFPSLRVPFGTYAGRPKAEAACRSSSSDPSPPMPLSSPSGDSAPPSSSLREAAASDADAMLAGMTVDEIKREQNELQKVLSDETVAFLRARHARRQACQVPASPSGDSSSVAKPTGAANREPTMEAAAAPSTSDDDRRTDLGAEDDPQADHQTREKERLARVLASIRTHQDLDAAYEAEMQVQGTVDGTEQSGAPGDMDEFALACDLLRSSARRQTLWAARVVAERLRNDLRSGAYCSLSGRETNVMGSPPPWPYPVLLPVSLRCLLDSSPSGTCGYVLHTYLLQSIYFLLQLRACKSHVVNLLDEDSDLAIHQLYFMDDTLPTPRMSSCYSGAEPATVDNSGSGANLIASATAAVYDTSSQSAQSDGLSFASDPMWTLLSRMRLIPRLASLLHITGPVHSSPPVALSDEAFVSIGGILAMLAVRSPGAAVAIAQHETLLTDLLVRSTLVPAPTDTAVSAINPKLAIPAVRLLCCLAQQSRSAAQCVDVKAFLFRVVATAADSPADEPHRRLQMWALVLWRTVLRYGIGLDLTPTLFSLCVSHITLGPNDTSLGPELFAALTNVARCVRVANQRRCRDAKSAPIPGETMELLFGAGAWITSTWRHVLRHLENGHEALRDDNPASQVHALRFYASCMRFMESYVAIHLVDESETHGEFKTNGLGVFEEDACVASLLSIVRSDKFRELMHLAMLSIFAESDGSDQPIGNRSRESALFLFLDSLTALTLQLWNYAPRDGSSSLIHVTTILEEAIVAESVTVVRTDKSKFGEGAQDSSWRIAWQNRFLFSSCNLVASLHGDHCEAVARGLCLFTIDMLQCGDESRAAILISHDWLFNVDATRSKTVSDLPSVLLRELCRTSCARSQLDHAFKLAGGFGITTEGFGAFDVQSLRSEADYSLGDGDSLGGLHLPLGPHWLWEMLSGVVIAGDGDVEEPLGSGDDEVAEIIAAALELILELETSNDKFVCWYMSTLDKGIKLYHVINVCLQPESIFQREKIQSTLTSLLDVYLAANINWSSGIITACESHSLPKASKTSKSSSRDGAVTPHDSMDASKVALNRILDESTRSLEDFVSDLCDAFTEFGAQYASFTRSIRTFLLPSFPSSVRCLVLEKLRGLTHLLSLEGEDQRQLLSLYLLGGLPTVDKSSKDAPEFIDALCALRNKTSRIRSESADFVHCLTVAVLVRSVANRLISINDDALGSLLTCMRRLAIQDRSLRIQVIQATARFLSSNGTISDLLEATFAWPSSSDEKDSFFSVSAIEDAIDERGWDRLWISLRASISDRLVGARGLDI